MSALAHMARDRGADVSGCDVRDGPTLAALPRRGCTIHLGHDPSHLAGVELVVRSSAIPESCPEIRTALQRHIPVIGRARMLSRFLARHHLVSVAGAHGKTTTTWIVAKLLLEARLDPSVMVGGTVEELGGNYRLGSGPFFVAEVDESDGSLLEFTPHHSIVTNIDLEHVDHYPDLPSVQAIFRRYLRRTKPGGSVILGADSEAALETLDAWPGTRLTYGFSPQADFAAENVRTNGGTSTFDVRRPGDVLRDLKVSLPGRHNVQNALAAVALASTLGIGDGALRAALGGLSGVGRRLEKKGVANGITWFDDYAHHPTEIRALLHAARTLVPGRLVAVFQPHRFSRTLHLRERFGDCFDGLDHLVLLPIYGAGEPPIEGVTTSCIEGHVREHGRVACTHFDDPGAAREHLLSFLVPGDTLLTIGAGDVYRLGEDVLAHLREREQ